MIRGALALIVWLLIGVGAALVFAQHNGYVLIRYDHWTMETSLVFFVFALIAAFVVLYIIGRLLRGTWLLPRRVRGFARRRRERRARQGLIDGLLNLWEGRLRQAETALTDGAVDSDGPGVHYLLAAHVAQRLGAAERSDRYLQLAAQSDKEHRLAQHLTRSDLLTARGQSREARDAMEQAWMLSPKEPMVLRRYLATLENLGEWEEIARLLPEAGKYHAFSDAAQWTEFAERTHVQLLSAAAQASADDLDTAWNAVPRVLREDPVTLAAYARGLHRQKREDQAASVIARFMRKQWDAGLALIYSELDLDDSTAQLATADEWLRRHGEQPQLLLVAGRLCLRNRLWGRARSYLENSIKRAPSTQAYMALGQLFQETNEPAAAQSAYRQGLELSLSQRAPAAMQAPSSSSSPTAIS